MLWFADKSGVSRLTKQSQLPVGVWADLPSKQALKNALAALRTGPIRFRRNQVIACEGDSADYIFFVVSGVVRSCRTFLNGERAVVAFYLPGDLFGWDNETRPFSIEAASDVMYAPKSEALIGQWKRPPVTRVQTLPGLVAQ